MVSKLLRLNPALYTTALVYLAVQVAFLSFLCSYYDYGLRNFTQWTLTQLYKFDYTREKIGWVKEVWKDVPKFDPGFSKKKIDHDKIETIDAEIHLGDTMQILNTEQLALFDGSRSSRPIYLAILGRVYNVDKGKKHYGVGGGYHFFAGRDATRAFVTGDFTEAGLIDDTSGLSHEDLLGIRDWVSFYEKDYKLVGVLVGRYYDINGNPTDELHNVLGRIQTAAEWRNSKAAEVEVFPPCNSEWHQSSGGRVWCTMKSGGIQRDWAGVPRLLYDPNTKQKRCACVKNFGVGLSSTGSVSNSRGDLDHPNLKVFGFPFFLLNDLNNIRTAHQHRIAAKLKMASEDVQLAYCGQS
ncbi:cytochrome b5-like Heme/Steroid binding domain protein [Dictyocaulus viviparus]|uniref:Cytochrome b5-like Heme/Steroid binding domain protein n=1 Tax=Dictyocaulus viviparus TaxID=29172 RepID=A0A0D8XWP6_DICVI|nr:cytochrome b5-like Heme/Steroid binding domain protein [Dictyocaulus viviparus]